MLSSLAPYFRRGPLTVLALGFSSGLPLPLVLGTLSIWLSKAGVDKSTIGVFALIGSPYALKFLWSHLVDHLPLPLLTRRLGIRRAWMLATQIALAAAMLMLGASDPAAHTMQVAYLGLILAICSATQDIAVDAFRVESLKSEEQGMGAAAAVFGYRVAMLASSAGALWIAQDHGWFAAYAAMAVLMGVGIVTTLLAHEPERHRAPTAEDAPGAATKRKMALWAAGILLGDVVVWGAWPFLAMLGIPVTLSETAEIFIPIGGFIGWAWILGAHFVLAGIVITWLTGKTLEHTTFAPLKDLTRHEGWWAVGLFIVLFKLGDAFAGVMTGPFVVEIGFDLKEIAGVMKTFGLVALLTGGFVGGAMIPRLGLLRALWIAGILQMLSNLLFLLLVYSGKDIAVLAVVNGMENFAAGIGGAVFVAYLSGLCNRHYTATQYALLSSLASVGRSWISAFSGWSAESLGWEGFFILSTLAAIPGLFMLWWLTRRLHFGASGSKGMTSKI